MSISIDSVRTTACTKVSYWCYNLFMLNRHNFPLQVFKMTCCTQLDFLCSQTQTTQYIHAGAKIGYIEALLCRILGSECLTHRAHQSRCWWEAAYATRRIKANGRSTYDKKTGNMFFQHTVLICGCQGDACFMDPSFCWFRSRTF